MRNAAFDTHTGRRSFLRTAAFAGAACLLSRTIFALGDASRIDILQIAYSGGNWEPRPTGLRRLAWEIHKRTSIDMHLEPTQVKPTHAQLAQSPLAYLSGDRPFPAFDETTVKALHRYLLLGGTIVVDPAYTSDGDSEGFLKSVQALLKDVLPGIPPVPIKPGHVIFRAFYDLPRAIGRRKGSPGLLGYSVGNRIAVIQGDHDMAGAWARDNLGNWEFEVNPGGESQRESAFRLGVNLVMYALCGDYKNEQPHRRFGHSSSSGSRP